MKTEKKENNYEFELFNDANGDYICITDKRQSWQDPTIVPICEAEQFIKSFSGIAYKAKTGSAA